MNSQRLLCSQKAEWNVRIKAFFVYKVICVCFQRLWVIIKRFKKTSLTGKVVHKNVSQGYNYIIYSCKTHVASA